jgi:hypothetical protein
MNKSTISKGATSKGSGTSRVFDYAGMGSIADRNNLIG